MTSLTAPRYELPLIDIDTGRMTREWYKFLVQLGNSVGPSSTNTDDLRLFESMDASEAESRANKALKDAGTAISLLLYGSDDPVKSPDLSILAWWPGESK